jgi:uncharacterized membrane protein
LNYLLISWHVKINHPSLFQTGVKAVTVHDQKNLHKSEI